MRIIATLGLACLLTLAACAPHGQGQPQTPQNNQQYQPPGPPASTPPASNPPVQNPPASSPPIGKSP